MVQAPRVCARILHGIRREDAARNPRGDRTEPVGRGAVVRADCGERDYRAGGGRGPFNRAAEEADSLELVSRPHRGLAKVRASEPTRAEWGSRGPASERVGESE